MPGSRKGNPLPLSQALTGSQLGGPLRQDRRNPLPIGHKSSSLHALNSLGSEIRLSNLVKFEIRTQVYDIGNGNRFVVRDRVGAITLSRFLNCSTIHEL